MSIKHAMLVRRIAAVSLLVVVITGIYNLTVSPYMNLITDYKSEIVSLSERISRFNALIEHKEKFQKQLRAVKNDRMSSQFLIKAGTVTLASAALQQKIKQVVQSKGAQLISTQVSLPTNDLNVGKKNETKKNYPVSIKVAMKASIDSTYEIFHAMESSTNPLVIIDEVSIGRIHQGRRLNVSSKKEQEILDVRYTVTAHMKTDG